MNINILRSFLSDLQKKLIILNKRKHTKNRNREVTDKPEHPHEAHKF